MSDKQNGDAERPVRKKPETLRLNGLAAGLTVDDLQASLHWYCDVVGFHLAQRFEHEGELRGAALQAGTVMIMVSQDDWGAGRDRKKGQAIRLHLMASQDIDDVADAIRSRGGTLATEPTDQPWGAREFNLVDPDGFQMTISSWKGELDG